MLNSDLSDAYTRYLQRAGNNALLDFSKENLTWDDVLRKADLALEKYHDAGKGAKGLIHKTFRRLGDNHAAISPWLACVPQDKYTLMLNGDLALVFAVCECPISLRRNLLIACEMSLVSYMELTKIVLGCKRDFRQTQADH